MEAYRDQYATMFNNGRKVTLIAISVDADTTLAAWAREKDFPMAFASDADGRVGRLYSANDSVRRVDTRALLVIGPDGRVVYSARPFRALAASAYTELAKVIDSISPPPPDSIP